MKKLFVIEAEAIIEGNSIAVHLGTVMATTAREAEYLARITETPDGWFNQHVDVVNYQATEAVPEEASVWGWELDGVYHMERSVFHVGGDHHLTKIG